MEFIKKINKKTTIFIKIIITQISNTNKCISQEYILNIFIKISVEFINLNYISKILLIHT